MIGKRKLELSSSQIIAKKRKALNRFRRYLLSSQEGKNVGKIILFGSLVRGEVRDSSDVDVLILASGNLNDVENAAADAAFEAGMDFGESIEPLVYCLDEARYPSSYFLYNVSRKGEEIYSMDEAQIRREESRGYRDLALEYLEGAMDSLKSGHPRLAVDAAYNAAELCAKGLLLLKGTLQVAYLIRPVKPGSESAVDTSEWSPDKVLAGIQIPRYNHFLNRHLIIECHREGFAGLRVDHFTLPVLSPEQGVFLRLPDVRVLDADRPGGLEARGGRNDPLLAGVNPRDTRLYPG